MCRKDSFKTENKIIILYSEQFHISTYNQKEEIQSTRRYFPKQDQ